jgi:hypothetical protein
MSELADPVKPLPNHPKIPDDTHLDKNAAERRFPVPPKDADFIDELKKALAKYTKAREYHVYTIYLDNPKDSWLTGDNDTKYRFRNYDGLKAWYLEQKRHSEHLAKTFKRRVKMTWNDLESLKPLVPVFADKYDRLEYDWDGVRVTIDSKLTALDKDLKEHAVRPGFVVEVKGNGKLPDAIAEMLEPYEDEKFSKSKWVRKQLGL